jgi:hypothetical protein
MPAAAGGNQHALFPCPRSRHVGIRRVQHPVVFVVSCASRGGRRTPHSAAASAVSAPSGAGPSPSREAYEEFLHVTRLALACRFWSSHLGPLPLVAAGWLGSKAKHHRECTPAPRARACTAGANKQCRSLFITCGQTNGIFGN